MNVSFCGLSRRTGEKSTRETPLLLCVIHLHYTEEGSAKVPAIATAESRTALSLRLPSDVIERVYAYASSQRITKTDAFLHFLRLGMGLDEQTHPSADVSVTSRLDDMMALIRAQHERMTRGGVSNETERRAQEALVRDAVRRASAEYSAIKRAYLFGSFARGDFREGSDVDVRLIIDRNEHFTLTDLARYAKRVETLSGREADVVTSDHIKNEALARSIENEKVLVYEREER